VRGEEKCRDESFEEFGRRLLGEDRWRLLASDHEMPEVMTVGWHEDHPAWFDGRRAD
jgi:hypothetical protein